MLLGIHMDDRVAADLEKWRARRRKGFFELRVLALLEPSLWRPRVGPASYCGAFRVS
jgi:hypothetical protein